MDTTISFSEFNAYCKCPLLWYNVYRNKNTVTKPINYKELAFKNNCNDINIDGMEDVCVKARAVRQYMINTDSDTIFVLGSTFVRDKNFLEELKSKQFCLSDGIIKILLPIPDVFVSQTDSNDRLILTTTITSSSGLYKQTPNILSHLQRQALIQIISLQNLKQYNNSTFRIAIKTIKTSSLKMKKAETDEEFEARRAELIKKSKTGTSKAQKQQGESFDEFFQRYSSAITHSIEFENESFLFIEKVINNNLRCFYRDKDNSVDFLSFNPNYCCFCDYNNNGICKNILGESETTINNGYVAVVAK
jgi:hypothetical protein